MILLDDTDLITITTIPISSYYNLNHYCNLDFKGFPLIAQLVKNLPATQETVVWFLGREDPLQKGKATHLSILAWRIPWTV